MLSAPSRGALTSHNADFVRSSPVLGNGAVAHRLSITALPLCGRVVPNVGFSPAFLANRPQLDRCAELGIAFLPWGPLEGFGRVDDLGPVGQRFKSLASKHEVSVHRLAIASVLAQSPVVVPIPGATRPQSILDDVAALAVHLEDEDMAWLSGEGTADHHPP